MHDGEESAVEEGVVVRKRRKGIYILPNLFTLAALFGGFYAIVMAMNGRFDMAAIGVFCAMVLDSLDGRVARMTNTQSAFGEQMDSLSDMVSFGAAPALIAYVWALNGLGRCGWGAGGGLHLAHDGTGCGARAGQLADLDAGHLDDVRVHAVCRPDHGDERAVLQLQGRADEKERAVRGHRADCAGHCRHQHPSSHRAVRRVRAVWAEWLWRICLAQITRAANECDQHVHGRT